MAITSLQVTLSGTTQVSTTSIKARWITFQNTAAAAMRIADANVTSSRGIPLAASTGSFTVQPYSDPSLAHDLSQWFVKGTDTNILDIVYDKIGS